MQNEIIDVLTDRLRVLMREHGVKAAPLARRAQLNESAVRDILRGRSKNPGIVTLNKIASVMNLRPSALFEAQVGWPVVGVIEGEGEVRDAKEGEEATDTIPNPFFFNRADNYAGLLNRSSAIEPLAFLGDYVLFEMHSAGIREADIGRPCYCELKDGRRVVRVTRMGDSPSRLHLSPVGLYGSPELNVEVVSASRVVMSLPSEFVPNLPEPTHESSSALHEDKAAYTAAKK